MAYKYKTKDALNALILYVDRPDILWMPNCYFGGGECDLLAISFHGYATEYEIKITQSDWNADKGKPKWKDQRREKVNQFYYCIPKPLLAKLPKWVDERFGIITFEFHDDGRWIEVREHRKAQKLNNTRKLEDDELLGVMKKGLFRYKDSTLTQAKEELKRI